MASRGIHLGDLSPVSTLVLQIWPQQNSRRYLANHVDVDSGATLQLIPEDQSKDYKPLVALNDHEEPIDNEEDAEEGLTKILVDESHDLGVPNDIISVIPRTKIILLHTSQVYVDVWLGN